MRIKIWAHDAQPETHLPLCRKKLNYVEDLLIKRQLRMVDPRDIRKGCIAMRHMSFRDDDHAASLTRAAGGGFDSAWGIRQSGYAGPLCWQLMTR